MASKKLNPHMVSSFSMQKEEKVSKILGSRIPTPIQRASSDEDEKGQEAEKKPAPMASFFPKVQQSKDPKAEARKKAFQNFLKVDSDDDLGSTSIPVSEHSSEASTVNIQRYTSATKPRESTPSSQPPSEIPNISMLSINTAIPEHTGVIGMRPLSGEARIVAPNVSKLSPHSAVEVRLQSSTESVAVLCSVDVLKMRSGFFHDILNEQEKSAAGRAAGTNTVPLNHSMQSNILWRDPIVIPEASPFEAAAFLESLHEGRTLFRGEWNYCWARLSVTWVIEELILEYSNQIEEHMNKMVGIIHTQNWRTNPSVLAGMRISVFRKGSNPIPTVVTGTIVESPTNIGYSKIRVLFDNERAVKNVAASNIHATAMTSPASASSMDTMNMINMNLIMDMQSPSLTKPSQGISSSGPVTPQLHSSLHHHPSLMLSSMSLTENPNQIVGDVSEPLWVQSSREGSAWCDPDDLFMMEAKRFLTLTDKRVFWEMARALIDFPEISLACKTGIRSAQDLTTALKRPEFRVLWTTEAAENLPRDMASELIRSAYCPVLSDSNKP